MAVSQQLTQLRLDLSYGATPISTSANHHQHNPSSNSILFSKREAQQQPLEDVSMLGYHGCMQLSKLDSRFQEFTRSLFSGKVIDRNLLTMDEQEEISTVIRRFSMLVIPYFVMRPAQKCLEWLIRGYRIEEYSKDTDSVLVAGISYMNTEQYKRLARAMMFRRYKEIKFANKGKMGPNLMHKNISVQKWDVLIPHVFQHDQESREAEREGETHDPVHAFASKATLHRSIITSASSNTILQSVVRCAYLCAKNQINASALFSLFAACATDILVAARLNPNQALLPHTSQNIAFLLSHAVAGISRLPFCLISPAVTKEAKGSLSIKEYQSACLLILGTAASCCSDQVAANSSGLDIDKQVFASAAVAIIEKLSMVPKSLDQFQSSLLFCLFLLIKSSILPNSRLIDSLFDSMVAWELLGAVTGSLPSHISYPVMVSFTQQAMTQLVSSALTTTNRSTELVSCLEQLLEQIPPNCISPILSLVLEQVRAYHADDKAMRNLQPLLDAILARKDSAREQIVSGVQAFFANQAVVNTQDVSWARVQALLQDELGDISSLVSSDILRMSGKSLNSMLNHKDIHVRWSAVKQVMTLGKDQEASSLDLEIQACLKRIFEEDTLDFTTLILSDPQFALAAIPAKAIIIRLTRIFAYIRKEKDSANSIQTHLVFYKIDQMMEILVKTLILICFSSAVQKDLEWVHRNSLALLLSLIVDVSDRLKVKTSMICLNQLHELDDLSDMQNQHWFSMLKSLQISADRFVESKLTALGKEKVNSKLKRKYRAMSIVHALIEALSKLAKDKKALSSISISGITSVLELARHVSNQFGDSEKLKVAPQGMNLLFLHIYSCLAAQGPKTSTDDFASTAFKTARDIVTTSRPNKKFVKYLAKEPENMEMDSSVLLDAIKQEPKAMASVMIQTINSLFSYGYEKKEPGKLSGLKAEARDFILDGLAHQIRSPLNFLCKHYSSGTLVNLFDDLLWTVESVSPLVLGCKLGMQFTAIEERIHKSKSVTPTIIVDTIDCAVWDLVAGVLGSDKYQSAVAEDVQLDALIDYVLQHLEKLKSLVATMKKAGDLEAQIQLRETCVKSIKGTALDADWSPVVQSLKQDMSTLSAKKMQHLCQASLGIHGMKDEDIQVLANSFLENGSRVQSNECVLAALLHFLIAHPAKTPFQGAGDVRVETLYDSSLSKETRALALRSLALSFEHSELRFQAEILLLVCTASMPMPTAVEASSHLGKDVSKSKVALFLESAGAIADEIRGVGAELVIPLLSFILRNTSMQSSAPPPKPKKSKVVVSKGHSAEDIAPAMEYVQEWHCRAILELLQRDGFVSHVNGAEEVMDKLMQCVSICAPSGTESAWIQDETAQQYVCQLLLGAIKAVIKHHKSASEQVCSALENFQGYLQTTHHLRPGAAPSAKTDDVWNSNRSKIVLSDLNPYSMRIVEILGQVSTHISTDRHSMESLLNILKALLNLLHERNHRKVVFNVYVDVFRNLLASKDPEILLQPGEQIWNAIIPSLVGLALDHRQDEYAFMVRTISVSGDAVTMVRSLLSYLSRPNAAWPKSQASIIAGCVLSSFALSTQIEAMDGLYQHLEDAHSKSLVNKLCISIIRGEPFISGILNEPRESYESALHHLVQTMLQNVSTDLAKVEKEQEDVQKPAGLEILEAIVSITSMDMVSDLLIPAIMSQDKQGILVKVHVVELLCNRLDMRNMLCWRDEDLSTVIPKIIDALTSGLISGASQGSEGIIQYQLSLMFAINKLALVRAKNDPVPFIHAIPVVLEIAKSEDPQLSASVFLCFSSILNAVGAIAARTIPMIMSRMSHHLLKCCQSETSWPEDQRKQLISSVLESFHLITSKFGAYCSGKAFDTMVELLITCRPTRIDCNSNYALAIQIGSCVSASSSLQALQCCIQKMASLDLDESELSWSDLGIRFPAYVAVVQMLKSTISSISKSDLKIHRQTIQSLFIPILEACERLQVWIKHQAKKGKLVAIASQNGDLPFWWKSLESLVEAVKDCYVVYCLRLPESMFESWFADLKTWSGEQVPNEWVWYSRSFMFLSLMLKSQQVMLGLSVPYSSRLLDEIQTLVRAVKLGPDPHQAIPKPHKSTKEKRKRVELEAERAEDQQVPGVLCLRLIEIACFNLEKHSKLVDHLVDERQFDGMFEVCLDRLFLDVGFTKLLKLCKPGDPVDRTKIALFQLLAALLRNAIRFKQYAGSAPSGGAIPTSYQDMTTRKRLIHVVVKILETGLHSSWIHVRLVSLDAIRFMVKEIGSDFLVALPEVIPLLAEGLEDENQLVEDGVRSLVHDLEVQLGENILDNLKK